MDTEPFTTSRVQVKLLALPVKPRYTSMWPRQRSSFPRTLGQAAQSYFPTCPRRGTRAQCGWRTQSRLPKLLGARCRMGHLPSPRSFRLVPGLVLVEQRVTWQAGKYPVRKKCRRSRSHTHTPALQNCLRKQARGQSRNPRRKSRRQSSLCDRACRAFCLSEGADRTRQHGRRDANGELPTRICVAVAVEVACLSGRCDYPRLGPVVLCTIGGASSLKSETTAFMTRTCLQDGGKAALRGARNRIVDIGKGAVVPHTHVRLIRTMGAFFSAIVTETTTVVSAHDTLGVVEFLTRANQRHIPGKSPIWTPGRPDTGKERRTCRWQRRPKHKTRCPFEKQSPLAIRAD